MKSVVARDKALLLSVRVCVTRKLKVNAGKNKVVIFKRKEVKLASFCILYGVSMPVAGKCEVISEGEREIGRMKEGKERLDTVL